MGTTIEIPTIDGKKAKIKIPGSAVISCDKGSIKVRKPNVKGIMMAKRAQVTLMDAEVPSPTVSIVSQSMPEAKPAGKKFEGASSAQEVAKLLRDEANVI